MQVHLIQREQRLSQPPEEVFPFFSDALNLERLTPPWLHFRVLSVSTPRVRAGTLIRYRLRLHGIPVRWLTRIEDWRPGVSFVDAQMRGPYRLWHHTHEFRRDGDGTLMRDTVRYAMHAGPLGEAARRWLVVRDLERIFDYRRDEVERLFGGSAA